MKKVPFILLSFMSAICFSQNVAGDVLSYQEFIYNVISEHPMAKSAKLKQKIAKANLLSAKGGFDPSITSSIDQKQFDNKEYYDIFTNKVTIPTPIGINITGGFDNNNGKFLNPQNKTTNKGLWSAGLEIDVLQGLFTNERRTALKQAKAYQQVASAQQQQLLNTLVYNASKAYAAWQQYSSIYNIILKNLNLNKLYLKNTKSALASGEKTAIDTLEAGVYLQSSRIELIKYKQLLTEKKLKIENYLWLKNLPATLLSNIKPEKNVISYQNNDTNIDNNFDSIPVIAEKYAKKEVLTLKQKLNREKLKPKLKLKYNQLLSTDVHNISPNFNVDNYKWGASLVFPVFFRKERGKLKESNYKIAQINYEIDYKKLEIKNKIVANRQNQKALIRQIDLLEKNIKGYEKLLDAENQKFNFGESSLFLINKRQEKLIASTLKLLNSQNKLIINYLDYLLLTNKILPKE